MDDEVYTVLLLLLVVLPAFVGGAITHTQPKENTVGNAIGTVALVTSGMAVISTAFLSQEAVGMVETVRPSLTRSLSIEKIYVIRENSDTGKALQLTLKNNANSLRIKKLRVTAIGPSFQSATIDSFKSCSDSSKNPCLIPPYADNDNVFESNERLELQIPIGLKADTVYTLRVEAPQGQTERKILTPTVFTQKYTSI